METRTLNPRQALLWGKYDYSVGRGLEVGPLHQPIVPREYADVRYLDVFDRQQLQRNYGGDPSVPGEAIPEIDYPLFDGERVRSIPEAIGADAGFDWVMASHVIEHVPDLIGWLAQLAEITADGGDLVLAVPDRRYCFDLHRPGTTVGQMLQAHELKETAPSVRAVYDYLRSAVDVEVPRVWGGRPHGYEARIHDLAHVLSNVERARSGEYVDSHVWLFTPESWLEQMIELRRLGHSEWKVKSLTPTVRGQIEFYAILERLPRGGDWTVDDVAGEPAEPPIPDWLAEQATLHLRLDESSQARTALEREVAALRVETERLRKRNAKLELRDQGRFASRVRSRLERTPTGSAVLAALRRVRRQLHRRR